MKMTLALLLGIWCILRLYEPKEIEHVQTVGSAYPPRRSLGGDGRGRMEDVVPCERQADDKEPGDLLDFAIHAVHFLESRCGADPRCRTAGPYGELGEYQVTPIWWRDLRRITGEDLPAHEVGAYDGVLCRRLIRLYLAHYAGPLWGGAPTGDARTRHGRSLSPSAQEAAERVLRIYNGGPRGPSKRSTDPYIARFRAEYDEIVRTYRP